MSEAEGHGQSTDSANVHDNPAQQRYELNTPEGVAFAEYRPAGNAVMFTHTEVPQELEGQGIGSALVRSALDDVRAKGQMVIPMCPFVARYIAEHQEYLDLVETAQREALGTE